MALAIDGSSPAIATQTNAATTTVTSASFTPPAGSLLYIRWSWNSQTGTDPTQPTITDNLGTHLTYTLIDWSHRGDGPATDGQAAHWWAAVGTSAAMTITVTAGVSGSNNGGALSVTVLTGADTVTPIGAHGKSGSTSAASIAQSYTAQATGGWGFVADTDWDLKGAQTAGTGCTLSGGADGSANVGTLITYGFVRRSSADDSNGVSNTLNVTLPGTSTNLRWVYAEIKPATTVAAATVEPLVITQPFRPTVPPPVVIRSTLADPPVLTTRPPLVVSRPYQLPAATTPLLNRSTLADPPVSTTRAPLVVSQPYTPLVPPPTLLSRASLADVVLPAAATPEPLVVSQPAKPALTAAIILRGTLADPPVLITPQPVVVTAPVKPVPVAQPTILRSSLQDFATPKPLVVVPPAVKPWNAPPVILRSSLADPVVVTGVATPRPLVVSSPTSWPWTYRPLVLAGRTCDCTTHRPSTGTTLRPSSGTTTYALATTARPNTGVTTRPNTGTTEDPC